MFNQKDNTWTTQEGKVIPVGNLEDWHLLNIQRMLRELHDTFERDWEAYLQLAIDFGWELPGVKGYLDKRETENYLKYTIMKISQEVNRRHLTPRLPRTRPQPKLILDLGNGIEKIFGGGPGELMS